MDLRTIGLNAKVAKALEIENGAVRLVERIDTALLPYRALVQRIDAAIAPVVKLHADLDKLSITLK